MRRSSGRIRGLVVVWFKRPRRLLDDHAGSSAKHDLVGVLVPRNGEVVPSRVVVAIPHVHLERGSERGGWRVRDGREERNEQRKKNGNTKKYRWKERMNTETTPGHHHRKTSQGTTFTTKA